VILICLFLDANVLFTATHNPSGKAALIIDLGAQGYWEVISCSYAIEEARRNISIKFPDTLNRFETLMGTVIKVPSRSGRNCPVGLPEKDRPILEAAIQRKASHLLTGDIKDFGPFMNKPSLTGGVVIQSASEFLVSFMKSKSKKMIRRKN
jgi:predicted nucleic acid-binding protein